MEPLTELDYEWISKETNKLKDHQMDYFSYLMQQQYGMPFQESWKIQLPDLIHSLPPSKSHIQLLHSRDGSYDILNVNDPSDHWVASYYNAETGQIHILDSLWAKGKHIHEKWLTYLKKLYPFYPFNSKKISFVPVQRQLNGSDCGVFAIAYATSILKGIWPDQTQVQFDIGKMRQHVVRILRSSDISPFPCFMQPNTQDEYDFINSKEHRRKQQMDCKLINNTRIIIKSNVSPLSNKRDELSNNQTQVSNNEYVSISFESSESERVQNTLRNPSRQQFLQHEIRQGNRLHDLHMAEFHKIVKEFTDYKPRDTVLLQFPTRITPVGRNEKHIQILYSSNQHWILVYYDCKKLYIYDSLNQRTLHPDHLIYLHHLFPFYVVQNRNVIFCKVQHQTNGQDCGVYAIALAISLI